jgi:CIC family chloride channel protein
VTYAAASVVVIASGGSAGPEGPVAALGAAIGSSLARLFRVTPRQRRLMLIAGCAAGVGAIFRCPLGGALFAVSVPYSEGDYESEAIVPSVVASVVSYTVFMSLWGLATPLLPGTVALVFASAWELIPYAFLGLACGLVSILFSLSFRFVSGWLAPALPLPSMLRPAVGGLVTGGLACLVPAVIDSRYRFVQQALDGSLFAGSVDISWWHWSGLLATVVLVKCWATSATVGSGGAGGLLGPSLFLGGVTGALAGAVLEALFPGLVSEPLRRALIPVGMGGVLAATMRVPLAAVVMVAEMTGSYRLIVPLMLVCAAAYVIGRRWGLNREQVPTAAQSPVHAADAVIRILESSRVRDFLEPNWPYTLAPETSLAEIARMIQPGAQPIFAVVEGGRLRGVVTLPGLERSALDRQLAQTVLAVDIMTEDVPTLAPEDDLYHALEIFRHGNLHVLPVVSDRDAGRWLGMLTRERVFHAAVRRIEASRRAILEEYQGLLAMNVGSMHLITTAGQDEALVYQITKTIWENRAEIVKQHRAGLSINETNAARFTGTPFHPGAIRFYQEIGIWSEADAGSADAGSADAGSADEADHPAAPPATDDATQPPVEPAPADDTSDATES